MQKFFILSLCLVSTFVEAEEAQRYSKNEKFHSYHDVVFPSSSNKELICDAKEYNINKISEETDANPADDPVDE